MDDSIGIEEHGSSDIESENGSSSGSEDGNDSLQAKVKKEEDEIGSGHSRSSSPRSNKSFSGSASSHSRSVSPDGSHSPHSRKADNSDDEGSDHSLSEHSSKASSRSGSASPTGKKSPVNESVKLADESRSQSPNLQIDDQSRSPAHSDAQSDHKWQSKSRSRSGTRSRAHSGSQNSESDAGSRSSRSPSASEKINAQDIFGDADDISLSADDDEHKSMAEFPDVSAKKLSRANSVDSKQSRSRTSSRSRTPSSSKTHSRSATPTSPQKEVTQSKDPEGEPIVEVRIEVDIPRIETNLGKEIHFVKLPNFLSVEARPFDADTYEDEIDEEETMDEEGRQRIKLKATNTIRWREYMNNDGRMIKESNARFVRWSDGSQTLHLGNEMFDVYRQPLHGDHNHMYIRQGTGLQGQAVFRTKLTFRPHSTESFTHKKMTMSLADRSQKTSGIKILTQVGKDPTTDRRFNLKKEEEKLRQAMRSQHKPLAKKKKTAGAHRDASFNYQHDDGSDDENSVSLNAIKNKYKKMAKAGITTARSGDPKASAIYSSDDDDDSDFERRRKKVDKAKIVKALRDSDSESNMESDDAGTEKNAKSSDEKSNNGNDSDSSK